MKKPEIKGPKAKGRKSGKAAGSFKRMWHQPAEAEYPKIYAAEEEIMNILKAKLGKRLVPGCHPFFSDASYFLTPLVHAKEIIANSRAAMSEYAYTEEVFDCDDFALVMKANFCQAAFKEGLRRAPHCFGILWGNVSPLGGHAINWMITADKELWFVEPQTGEVYRPRPKDDGIYFLLI
ncbi:MAG: lectin MOA-related protein [Myxococcales bacterium]|nr:lectin MOA-related protein [Myxococcales bacterium]